MAWDAPCFQQSIGAAATFDPSAVADVAATLHRRMMLTGARHALGPVLDIANDPRWGRLEETYGEDPYLAAVMGHAYIAALQGESLTDRRRRHGQAPHRARPGRRRPQHGARPPRDAPAPRRAALPVRGRRPPERDRQRDAGLLRRRWRAVPCLGRAPHHDPARRVGLRRRRRLRLHRDRDAGHPPPDDVGCLDRGRDGDGGRGGPGTAADRSLRGAAAGGAGGRPDRRAARGSGRRGDPADEVPAGPVREPRTSTSPGRRSSRRSSRTRPASGGPWRSARSC